jgi:hypothetical protein
MAWCSVKAQGQIHLYFTTVLRMMKLSTTLAAGFLSVVTWYEIKYSIFHYLLHERELYLSASPRGKW